MLWRDFPVFISSLWHGPRYYSWGLLCIFFPSLRKKKSSIIYLLFNYLKFNWNSHGVHLLLSCVFRLQNMHPVILLFWLITAILSGIYASQCNLYVTLLRHAETSRSSEMISSMLFIVSFHLEEKRDLQTVSAPAPITKTQRSDKSNTVSTSYF